MLLARGTAAGTTLTETLYEPGERPPRVSGVPETDASSVRVCDGLREVQFGKVNTKGGVQTAC